MHEGEPRTASGSLYSIDAGGAARCQLQGISISNGLCLSPDGAQLYFADSPTRTISAYELVEPEGVLGASRVFARTPEGAFPDGATVDADESKMTDSQARKNSFVKVRAIDRVSQAERHKKETKTEFKLTERVPLRVLKSGNG